MPKSGQQDRGPGDVRRPFAERGRSAGWHPEPHDVQREPLSHAKELQRQGEDFDSDIAPDPAVLGPGGHVDESIPAVADKQLHEQLSGLDNDELARISVLELGTRLEQGGTYLDLNDLARGPFKALGGQHAGDENRYVAKRDMDYELWNRLVGQDHEPEIERPTEIH